MLPAASAAVAAFGCNRGQCTGAAAASPTTAPNLLGGEQPLLFAEHHVVDEELELKLEYFSLFTQEAAL